jgi:preprotein translocase subunit SecG
MANILIVVYLLIVLAMIAAILLQRSEGGALGMGGGSGGLPAVRSSANLLTRTTGILGALFMATAIGLTILSNVDRGTQSILDSAAEGGGATNVLDALNNLQGDDDAAADAPAEGGAAVDDEAPDLAVPSSTPAAPGGGS